MKRINIPDVLMGLGAVLIFAAIYLAGGTVRGLCFAGVVLAAVGHFWTRLTTAKPVNTATGSVNLGK